VTRPRAADDFTTIRARLEELRRERAQALKKDDSRGDEEARLGGRGLLRGIEGRQRSEPEAAPTGPPSRRYGSGR